MLTLMLTLTLTHAVAKANDKITDRKVKIADRKVKITDRKVETTIDRKVMPMRGRKAIQRPLRVVHSQKNSDPR